MAEVEPEPEPEPVVAEVEPEPEPVVAEVEPEPEPEPVVAEVEPEPEPEPVAAEVEPEPALPPLRVVAWDEDDEYVVHRPLAEALDQPPAVADSTVPTGAETEPQPIAAEAEPEPIAAEAEHELEPEPVAAAAEHELEPEPVAAAAEPEPEEPAAAVVDAAEEPERRAPRLAPISDTILRFPPRGQPDGPVADEPAAAIAADPELAARRAQLDLLGLGDPGQGPVAAERAAMPYRSRGAAVSPAELARQASAAGSFWEASAREVAAAAGQIGVQSCGQCGLSLSATARFCRRCGTQQARSA